MWLKEKERKRLLWRVRLNVTELSDDFLHTTGAREEALFFSIASLRDTPANIIFAWNGLKGIAMIW